MSSLDLEKVRRQYSASEDTPLAGYVTAMVVFASSLVGALVWMTRRRAAPLSLRDVALLGIATHKLSRIVSKDFVTAPIRAPFTRRAKAEGAGEVHDEARGDGARRALGYLLTCPYCLGPWIASALSTSMALRPAQTGFVVRVLTAVTISDFLHLGYSRLNESRRVIAGERQILEQANAQRLRQ
jgi:hypothetical protein